MINTRMKSTAVPAFPAASVKGGGRAGVPSGQIQVGSTSAGLPGFPVFNLGGPMPGAVSPGIELVDRASPYVAASLPVPARAAPVAPPAPVSAWSRMVKPEMPVEEYTGGISTGAHTEGPLEPAYEEPYSAPVEAPARTVGYSPEMMNYPQSGMEAWIEHTRGQTPDERMSEEIANQESVDDDWKRGILDGVRSAWDGGEAEGIDAAGTAASDWLGNQYEADLNDAETEWLDSLQNQINLGFKP